MKSTVETGVKAPTIMKGRARWYPCPNCGSNHPSTTTCLGVIGSEALMGWSAKHGTKKMNILLEAIKESGVTGEVFGRITKGAEAKWKSEDSGTDFWKSGAQQAKDAADYGTQAHAAFEMFIKGIDIDLKSLPEPSRNAFMVFEKFTKENKLETISTEKTFYNCQMGYAGTADWVGKINGKLSLGDWKTSNGIFESYIIQAWANAMADECQHGDRIYEQVIIGRFGKDGTTDLLIVPRRGLNIHGFAGYEQARVLMQATIPWFNYKQEWEMQFPYKRK